MFCVNFLLILLFVFHVMNAMQKPVQLPAKHRDGPHGDFFLLTYKKAKLRGTQELEGLGLVG